MGPSLLQAEQLELSQPFLTEKVFHPPDHFCGHLLEFLLHVHVFPVLSNLEVDVVVQAQSFSTLTGGEGLLVFMKLNCLKGSLHLNKFLPIV